ncbi:MAG TPA: PDZ domain-containing protein, partial [Planctomycetota bacterium]|nr:PDZ domain-containing protein [Planctomycetota bacterium]
QKAPGGAIATVEGELAQLADEVGPAVVGVSVGGRRAESRRQGDSVGGAGVVVSPDGLVLTSSAIVPENAPRITITFAGGRRMTAREVRRDARSGLCLLRIEGASGLKAAKLAQHAAPGRGSIVATFGNPYGTITRDGEAAMSIGTLSAYVVSSDASGEHISYEVNAAVNPGSFGGPLVDRHGCVVGIVVPEYRNERWLGLACALDAGAVAFVDGARGGEAAQPVSDDDGSEQRGIIGLHIYEDSDEAAKVDHVEPGSAAEKAKLKAGDVVVSVNGRAVKSGREFAAAIRSANVHAGDVVTIVVDRDGFEKELKLRAAPAPESAAPAKPWLGLVAQSGEQGLLIDEIAAGSPADKAGLKRGDVIKAVNGARIARLDDLRAALEGKKPGDELAFEVSRKIDDDWWTKKETVKLGKKPGEAGARTGAAPRPAERPGGERQAAAPEKRPGFLGVRLENAGNGVRVTEVYPGTPAERGGLKTNDLIVEVSGEKADSIETFTKGLQRFGAGDKVELTVARGDDFKKTVEVTLGMRPAQPPGPGGAAPSTGGSSGAQAESKPAYIGFRAEEAPGGLRVIEVFPGGPAEKAGIKVGQVVASAGGDSVTTIDALKKVMQGRKAGDKLALQLADGSRVEVTLGARP